jgi:hypothetical protein
MAARPVPAACHARSQIERGLTLNWIDSFHTAWRRAAGA